MDIQHAMAWGIFLVAVLALLAFDLLVLHRKPREVRLREALLGAAVPVVCALIFLGLIYAAYNNHWLNLGTHHAAEALRHFYPDNGYEAAVQFVTGYIVELSLSADNVFLFVILMNVFKVPRHLQHRVLFWGVLGALVMRGIMIIVGATLLAKFQWLIYIFGAFLLFTAGRMLFSSHDEERDIADNFGSRLVRRFFPVHPDFAGKNFFVRIDGRRMATTLFVVLVCIEFTDLVFALDSIPAIFGITRDPFIVFTSNVFAILGLRSMYFLLAGIMDKFRYLKTGLAVVLGFVGLKMLLPGIGDLYGHYIAGAPQHWDIDEFVSLSIILATLAISIFASVISPPKQHPAPHRA
ncbi:MAG: TerC family protein [Phycisphaerae bacterium]